MKNQHSNELKAKVAIEALNGQFTIQEIAKKYNVHPNLVGLWKKHLSENATKLFDKKSEEKNLKELREKENFYLQQIGQLQIEKEFLKKKQLELLGKGC
jgi:transposase